MYGKLINVLIIFLGGGVPPGPENPYPISDQNIRFSTPYFRPDSQNAYPISDKMYTLFQTTLNGIYGVKDFVTPQTMFAFFFFAINVHGNICYSKNQSQTKQTEYTPYFRPKWQKCLKMVPFRVAHTWYGLYMGVPPPPPPPSPRPFDPELNPRCYKAWIRYSAKIFSDFW